MADVTVNDHTITATFQVPSSEVVAGTNGTVTVMAQAIAVPNELIVLRDDVYAAETSVTALEAAASTSATNAATSASAADASKVASGLSEGNAAASASAAASSATAASTSETNAAGSATTAQTAETGAITAKNATASLLDQFDDRYLGSKTLDPTTDNDGALLTEGVIYWNATDKVLKFYNGTAWVAPETLAATSASNAQTSASAAATSESNAATSATSASNSASAAATSETNASTSASNAAAEMSNHVAAVDPHTQYVQKVTGKALSTEDYTTTEKTKLGGIATGAQVNTVDSVDGLTGVVDLSARYETRRKNNLTAITDPAVTDDSAAGYQPLSRWLNTATSEIWLCISATAGAANWQQATLTLDELGSAALVNMGVAASEIRTNTQNETLFTDEQEATRIAIDNAITFAIALG